MTSNVYKKLERFKDDIDKAIILSEEFENSIAIDLYDFIHENNILKKAFYNVFNYFDSLSDNEKFKNTQERLSDSIIAMVEFTDQKEIGSISRKLEKENHGFIDRLKGEENNIKLRDLYKKIQDRDNYYILGQVTITSIDDPFLFTRTLKIRAQYDFIGHVFSVIQWEIHKKGDDQRCKELGRLIDNFRSVLDEFNNLIYRIPLRMKLRSFEEFIVFCAQRYPRKDYRAFYEMRGDDSFGKDKILKKIKNNASIVINELIESVSSASSQEQKEGSVFSYNPETGCGTLRSKEFKLTEDTLYKKIFDECYELKGKKLTRSLVLKILEISEEDDQSKGVDIRGILGALGDTPATRKSTKEIAITDAINKVSKTIRLKTGLDTREFVQNNGNLTLDINQIQPK